MEKLSDKLIKAYKNSKLDCSDWNEEDILKLVEISMNIFIKDIEEKGVNFKAH